MPSLQSGYIDALAAVLHLDEGQRKALETAQIQALRGQTAHSTTSRSTNALQPTSSTQAISPAQQPALSETLPIEPAVTPGGRVAQEQWLTLVELRARQALQGYLQGWNETLRQHAEHYGRLKSAEESARKSGDIVRRLLNNTGSQLVGAVTRVLRDLGFTVAPMNSTNNKPDEFRITTSPAGWEGLVLVRGYKRGLDVADLVRLGSSSALFATAYGRAPDAVWYVVNQFATTDPDVRPQPFRDHLDGASALWGIGGLIVDTRDLFKCWNAVDHGDLAPDQAQALLIGARGQFTYPSTVRRD